LLAQVANGFPNILEQIRVSGLHRDFFQIQASVAVARIVR
jgi:hypothetical protein